MNIYDNIKDFFKDGMKFASEANAVRWLINFLKSISLIAVIMILLIQCWNIIPYIHMPIPPLVATPFRDFLNGASFPLLIGLMMYYLFLGSLLRQGVIFLESKTKQRLLPFWNTLEEIFEVFALSIITLFFINAFIEFLHGLNIFDGQNYYMFAIYLIYSGVRWVNWIYIKNRNYWYYSEKKYTPFFDSDGKRIAQDDDVVYNQKLYQLFCIKHEGPENMFEHKDEWCLAEYDVSVYKKVISLEEAAKDEKGHLKVYQYGMGEDH